MKLGVDFDRVLFDTDSFNKFLKEKTGLHHVDEDVYDENGNYSPRKHAEASGINTEEVYKAMGSCERFLYEDIDLLKKLDHEVILVTRGKEKYQRAKIEKSGASKFVDRVKIVEGGSKNVGIDFLIDDREEEIERAGVKGFQLDRSKESLKDALEELREYEA
jgi:FMN phosphatase YigB (HAD superfamily)